jgi:hypothetical protein
MPAPPCFIAGVSMKLERFKTEGLQEARVANARWPKLRLGETHVPIFALASSTEFITTGCIGNADQPTTDCAV